MYIHLVKIKWIQSEKYLDNHVTHWSALERKWETES